MICSACGLENQPGARACARCGVVLNEPQGPSVTCGSCGATVHGPAGTAVPCHYCGASVLIPALPEAERPQPPPREAPPEQTVTTTTDDSSSTSAAAYAIVGVVVAVFLLVIVSAVVSGARHPGRHASSTSGSRSESVTIDSCRCAFGDGQTTPAVQIDLLAPPTGDPSRAYQIEIQTQDNVAHTHSTRTLATPSGAVLSGSVPPTLGVSCGPGIYLLVAGNVASAWSSVTGAHKWTTALASPMATTVAPAGMTHTDGTAFASRCTPLEAEGGRVTIPLVGGATTSLSLKYGTTR